MTRSFRVVLVMLFASSLYACGGGGSGGGSPAPVATTPPPSHTPTPLPTTTPSPPTPTPTPTRSPKPTPTPNAVTVSPNSILFSQSGPGDYTVTVSGGSGSYVVGTDTCTSQGFAEWQQDAPPNQNEYDVSYGVNVGKCMIQFVDQANSNNFAFLQVDNEHNPH